MVKFRLHDNQMHSKLMVNKLSYFIKIRILRLQSPPKGKADLDLAAVFPPTPLLALNHSVQAHLLHHVWHLSQSR